jgi:tRNA modification GTPase
VLFLRDLTRLSEEEYRKADEVIAAKLPAGVPVVEVWNKVDAVDAGIVPTSALALQLSARTGHGLDRLRSELLSIAGWQSAPEGVFIARERHLHALQRVDAHLMEAAALLVQQAQALDLLAEELRLAQNALSEITGEFSADDLLGVIFSRFCIGK